MSNTIIKSAQEKNGNGSRRASTERRRREILDAALTCFLQNGVAATTIEQIRIASKASHGSIYHLFRGKDEIALTLFCEGMRVYHEKMMRALEAETTAKGSIRAMIFTHLEDVVDDRALSIYLTRLGMADNIGELNEQFRKLSDEFVQAIWLHLKPFIDRGEIDRLPPELYAALIVGPIAHLSRSWLRGRIEFDLISATDRLAEAAWKSLQPHSSADGTNSSGPTQ